MLKKLICLLLVSVLVFGMAMAEQDDDIILQEEFLQDDVLQEEFLQDNPEWNFPVALQDMQPELVIVANKELLISKDFVVKPLVTMKTRKNNKDGSNANGGVRKASGGKMQLSEVCAEALVQMFDDADKDGIKLYLKSAYRSYKTQKTMYYNRLKKYGYDDGYVAMPGASDHQTGLGCDVVSYAWRDRGMNGKFGKTDEAKWMAEHCAEYGFVIRYPSDKEDITKIAYEPWHLRYVGKPAAQYIMSNGLCLEEFHDMLQASIDEYLLSGGDRLLVEPFIQVSAEN